MEENKRVGAQEKGGGGGQKRAASGSSKREGTREKGETEGNN